MSEEELFAALDALKAFDSGASDSGVRDPDLRTAVVAQLCALPDRECEALICRFIRSYYLSDDALATGYGLEDVRSFLDWLTVDLGIRKHTLMTF